jgi:hypothetical protein
MDGGPPPAWGSYRVTEIATLSGREMEAVFRRSREETSGPSTTHDMRRPIEIVLQVVEIGPTSTALVRRYQLYLPRQQATFRNLAQHPLLSEGLSRRHSRGSLWSETLDAVVELHFWRLRSAVMHVATNGLMSN